MKTLPFIISPEAPEPPVVGNPSEPLSTAGSKLVL